MLVGRMRILPAAAVLLAAVLAVAGHPVPSLAQEGSALAQIVPFEVAAADGTLLRGHVYLPDVEGLAGDDA